MLHERNKSSGEEGLKKEGEGSATSFEFHRQRWQVSCRADATDNTGKTHAQRAPPKTQVRHATKQNQARLIPRG